jgi:hypothetical protein
LALRKHASDEGDYMTIYNHVQWLDYLAKNDSYYFGGEPQAYLFTGQINNFMLPAADLVVLSEADLAELVA